MRVNSWLFSMSARALLGIGCLVACSNSSGPGDTTIELSVDPVTSPTNNANPTVTGRTDPGARVTVSSPRDTVSSLADSAGAFSLAVRLRPDAVNSITVLAQDSAGNRAGDTFSLSHDGRVPIVSFAAPLQEEITAGQSGFMIAVAYADQGTGDLYVSGVDPATLLIESDETVGGVFQRDGTISTAYPAGTNLAAFFDQVGAAEAAFSVPESLAFAPGGHGLRAQIADLAGNSAPAATVTFEITADPDRLVAVDASGAAGSSGNPLPVALINADTVAGVQFDLLYSTSVIAAVESVETTERAAAFGATDFNQVGPGRVRVLLFDVDGDVVLPGQGLILRISLAVQADAPSGSHALALMSVLLSDPGGATFQAPDVSSAFLVP